MLTAQELLTTVIRPTLDTMARAIGDPVVACPAAETLLLMVAAHESGGFRFRRQQDAPGREDPTADALGLWQMERVAYDDLMLRYFPLRPIVHVAVQRILNPSFATFYRLETDDNFACAMARAHLLKAPQALPTSEELGRIADYAKLHWNTPAGKATAHDYLSAYLRHYHNLTDAPRA